MSNKEQGQALSLDSLKVVAGRRLVLDRNALASSHGDAGDLSFDRY